MSTSSFASRARYASVLVCWSPRSACSPAPSRRNGPALLSGRSDRARAGVAGRVEGAALSRSGRLYEMSYNLFVTAGLQAVGHARAEHQHHRRSAGLELVHEPDWHDAGHGRRDRPRPQSSAPPPDPSRWVLIREKTSGAHPGFTARDAKGETWFLEFDPPVLPGRGDRRPSRRDEDLLGARLQPGGIVPDHVRSEARRDRSEGHDSPSDRQADAVHARRYERDPRARRAKRRTAPIASSPAG